MHGMTCILQIPFKQKTADHLPQQVTHVPGEHFKRIQSMGYRHLGASHVHARISFADFDSAFNTMHAHILAPKKKKSSNFWFEESLRFVDHKLSYQ